MMFGSRVGFSADLMVQLSISEKIKMAADGHRGYKSGHNFATRLPIYVMFD